MCSDVAPNRELVMNYLGFRHRESKIGAGGLELGAWLSVSPIVHELAFMRDKTGNRARFHHIAYWYGYPHNLLDLAGLCPDYGIRIETGPGKHGTTQVLVRRPVSGDVLHLRDARREWKETGGRPAYNAGRPFGEQPGQARRSCGKASPEPYVAPSGATSSAKPRRRVFSVTTRVSTNCFR